MKTFPVRVRSLTYCAMFAALFVALSFVTVPVGFSPVPVTLETMGFMLAGGVLGAGYGFFSIFIVVALTAIGLPLLHGAGGLSFILGPTGGFIWMFPVAALLIGYFVPRIRGTGIRAFVGIFIVMELFGSLLLYVTGVPWLAHVANLSFAKAMALGCYPYLAGDAVKALAATAIVLAVRRAFPHGVISGRAGRAEDAGDQDAARF